MYWRWKSDKGKCILISRNCTWYSYTSCNLLTYFLNPNFNTSSISGKSFARKGLPICNSIVIEHLLRSFCFPASLSLSGYSLVALLSFSNPVSASFSFFLILLLFFFGIGVFSLVYLDQLQHLFVMDRKFQWWLNCWKVHSLRSGDESIFTQGVVDAIWSKSDACGYWTAEARRLGGCEMDMEQSLSVSV